MSEGNLQATLYTRLGGYDALAAVAEDLLKGLMGDGRLGRFWRDRALDSIRRERQLLIEFLCASTGGPAYYMGRDMVTAHRGMGISESDWSAFVGYLKATLDRFAVPQREWDEVLAFVDGLKKDIVES